MLIYYYNLSYKQKHRRMRNIIQKPDSCPSCLQDKKLELANIGHKYLPILSDWIWLCDRCHMIQDGRLDKIPRIEIHNDNNTICLLCESTETYIKKNGHPQWFIYENGYICSKCYDKRRHRLYGRRGNKKNLT